MPMKSRRTFPPSGWIFYEPKTGWNAPGGVTFEECVGAIIQHRLSNPRFAGQWMTDVVGVSNELDHYTCLRLNGDKNYCDDNAPPSFPQGFPSHTQMRNPSLRRAVSAGSGSSHAQKTVAGIGLMIEWLGSGLTPVSKELAEKRAAVCVQCPLNQIGDFWQRVDANIAKKIKTAVAIKNDMKLETSLDNNLHSCLGCDCWLPLKCHVPIEHIKSHTSDAVIEELKKGNDCWQLKEMK